MKILLVARWPVGGIRTYIRYIYANPLFSDYEITLIAPDQNLNDFLISYLPPGRITFHKTADNNKSIISEVKKHLQKNHYDVIHSHGFSAGVLTSIAIFGKSVRHAMTAHDVFRKEQFKGVKGRLKLFLLNLIYRRLDAVLTVGSDCQDNFSEFMPLIDKRKIINIDHGVDVQKFATAQKVDFRNELALPEDKKIIGFFGRFMSQKGFSDLVRAIEILARDKQEPAMPIVLTFGWGGYVREEYERIDNLGLTKYFKQMPFTDDMPSAIRGVDMVVMPSRWEACGLLAMEVLSAGVPLVGTNCIGLRCVLEGTPALIVDPYAPEALAKAINEQMQSCNKLFIDYQRQAVERFNLDSPAQELHDFYQTIGRQKQ